MADPKDASSFFRKMVKFVANPATEWSEIGQRTDDANELERSELKAMIERKRRNDFVRKREFDTLRKLRRDGLSPEQLAALGGTARVDSEARLSESTGMARQDLGVKAKIDEIEQQMVGAGDLARIPRRGDPTARFADAPPAPRATPAPRTPLDAAGRPWAPPVEDEDDDDMIGQVGAADWREPPPAAPPRFHAPALDDVPRAGPAAAAPSGPSHWYDATVPLPGRGEHAAFDDPAVRAGAAPPFAAGESGFPTLDFDAAPAADVGREAHDHARSALDDNDLRHDPALDEAVIAFANADFAFCEQLLTDMVRPGGERHDDADTWRVLFDHYRAIGSQAAFESLAYAYATHFGRSAPQWSSLPALVAQAAAERLPPVPGATPSNEVGFACPAVLDADAVHRLGSVTMQLPQPWVVDFSALEHVEVEAASHLQSLLRQWSAQAIEMRWVEGTRLFDVLADAAPTGARDADPAYWMARLEALRLVNRPDQFDEAAIDFCVTYEVSPPPWQKARCTVRLVGAGQVSTMPPTAASEASTIFVDSELQHDSHWQTASVELSGQLSGDISETLRRIDRSLGPARLVQVSCAKLIRVDFPAAGDLLNWVAAKQAEQRRVAFVDAHRLVALFFGAMGIAQQARVQVPKS